MLVKDLAKAMEALANAETLLRQSNSPAVDAVAGKVHALLGELADLRGRLAGK